LAVLSLLPIANWIGGGHEAPWYPAVAGEWLNGSVIALGIALVAWIVVRRTGWWPTTYGERVAAVAAAHPRRTALVVAVVAAGLYATIAQLILSGRPLLIDEIVQVMQARFFAEGAVAGPASPFPEFFSALHVVDVNGKVFSQFPPGGPLMLLPGVWLGTPWLAGPLWGAIAAAFFWLVVQTLGERPGVALGAVALFVLAPFTAFMAGSHMNHVPTLAWVCAAMYGLLRVTRAPRATPPWAAFCGLAFGAAAAIRPVDGAAFAVPAALWLLARSFRTPGAWRDLVAAGIGVSVPVAGVLVYNVVTTGDPLLFGYELLWGKSHGLGFHRAPWGVTHTPARGLELVNLFFLRLQTYLFEAPVPSLLPAVAALAITPAVRGFDRYLLWASTLLVFGYFAYWHDGFFLGPRFFYLLIPALALWTVRLPALIRSLSPERIRLDRLVMLTYLISGGIGVAANLPLRTRQYAGGLTSMRLDFTAPARRAGIENALILVRESWGSQLIARLWALGVSRSETETLYRAVDSCALEQALTSLEGSGISGAAATASLGPLLRDSMRVVASELSPDKTERVLPGSSYPPLCVRRIAEDHAGYTFLAPLLAVDHGSNVYARDLHARDSVLLRAYEGRPVYVLRPASSRVGAPLELHPLALDSARAEWAESHAAGRAADGTR
jgi:hypothetical protein